MWDLIVSVPDHCLSFYFSHDVAHSKMKRDTIYVSKRAQLVSIDRDTYKLYCSPCLPYIKCWDAVS